MDKIKLSFPAKAENISVARLTTSAICMKLNLNIDDLEDMKLCVGEACNIILEKAKSKEIEKIKIEFITEEDIKIVLKSEYEDDENQSENGESNGQEAPNYPLMIIESLMDGVELIEDEEEIRIEMIKEMR